MFFGLTGAPLGNATTKREIWVSTCYSNPFSVNEGKHLVCGKLVGKIQNFDADSKKGVAIMQYKARSSVFCRIPHLYSVITFHMISLS